MIHILKITKRIWLKGKKNLVSSIKQRSIKWGLDSCWMTQQYKRLEESLNKENYPELKKHTTQSRETQTLG